LAEIALAEIALGASKHPMNSLAGLPLLICAPKLNGLRYGAISASGKKGCDCKKKPAGVNRRAEILFGLRWPESPRRLGVNAMV
jgi:hypothetical protein